MNFKVSGLYRELFEKARWSHAHGRNVFQITPSDIDAARLFDYAYRSQAIGTFHATRVAIEQSAVMVERIGDLSPICMLLRELETKAGDVVPRDFRALVSTFHSYHQCVSQVVDLLNEEVARHKNQALENILQRFIQNIERVTGCNGIYLARDLVLPQQGAFVVPTLGISILPLIYGDHHSWNVAFLAATQFGVSVHRHLKGAEIHLGFAPTHGQTILGSHVANVSEGYAMPIPPMTDHGFRNKSGHDHILPFIFGSMLMTGWGVFFDVETRENDEIPRNLQPLESEQMNKSVFLDRAIKKISTCHTTKHEVLIPPERAGSSEIGGLQLSANVIPAGEMTLLSQHYRIISIRSGVGRVSINGWTAEVRPHDHFGVPPELSCYLGPIGPDPLVFLDVTMRPLE